MSAVTSPPGGAPGRRIAIACQGGGSHTAFTAGVLKRLLLAEEIAPYRVVGLSGTSGGAVCALLTWYALLDDDRPLAARLLEKFWADNSADQPWEQLANVWMLWASTMQELGAMPVISPYDSPVSTAARDTFLAMVGRQVDFGRVRVDSAAAHPLLLIGAVDVLSGEFRTFSSRRDRITAETVLASAAIPNLFRTVHLGGGAYWDGLFSQNPPVRELMDSDPDELWVIQINPKTADREPRTTLEIADRRNELSGNLSLYQELRFIEKIDQLLEEGVIAPGGRYKPVVVRIIELSPARLPAAAGAASKLNRDPAFIRALIAHGERQADEFRMALAFERTWASHDADAVLGLFAEDAEIVSVEPFERPGRHRGPEQLRTFVEQQLLASLTVDLTRKQVAGERVAWTVRARITGSPAPVLGSVETEFSNGKITRLRLDASPAG